LRRLNGIWLFGNKRVTLTKKVFGRETLMSFNKIILVGNLGKDPELRYTPQSKAVCSFTMATNERRKDRSGETQDVTTWFKITVWDNRAEVVSKYLQKGSPVYVEGRLRIEEWQDRDGKTRYTLDVQATDVQFIGGRPEDGGSPRPVTQNTSSGRGYDDLHDDEPPTHSGGNDEDIPF
jgi:single-strand DNA-binding protein